jgi:hypothetical protein
MINPCKRCLVQAACTKICEDKEKYTDVIINNLTIFSDKYLYTGKNGRYKYKLTKKLRAKHTKLLEVCQANNDEYQKIICKVLR